MLLDFLWIETFGVIQGQGYNFNPNAYYSFDPQTGEIFKKAEDVIPDNFFHLNNSTVQRVTALLGANGTGKSSMLEFLAGFLTSTISLKGFIITDQYVVNKSSHKLVLSKEWVGAEPLIVTNEGLSIHRRKNRTGLSRERAVPNPRHAKKPILNNLIANTRLIYFSGELNLGQTNRVNQTLLSREDDFENSDYLDISDVAMMARDQRNSRADKVVYSGENPVLAYRAGESQRFIDLIISKHRSLIPFPLSGLLLNVRFSDIQNIFFDSYDHMSFTIFLGAIIPRLSMHKPAVNKRVMNLMNEVQRYGIAGYFQHKLDEHDPKNKGKELENMFYHQLLLRHIREQLTETIGELTEENRVEYLLGFFFDLAHFFETNERYLVQAKQYLQRSTFARSSVGKLNIKTTETFFKNLEKAGSWKGEEFSVRLSDLTSIKAFLRSLKTFEKRSGLRYNVTTSFDLEIRGLSTGEKQFLKLFSRFLFFGLNNANVYSGYEQYLLLIDEFDIGFHPIWQRQFLYKWISFLEKFVNTKKREQISVQIILTSHSPFVASDLPKQCINFIDKKPDELFCYVDDPKNHVASFGANISDLYDNTFFLNGPLMGDFSKAKIDALFEALSPEGEIVNSTETKKMIALVGEPIIKLKLLEMYSAKTGENQEQALLELQQEYIAKRLNEIRQNDSNKV